MQPAPRSEAHRVSRCATVEAVLSVLLSIQRAVCGGVASERICGVSPRRRPPLHRSWPCLCTCHLPVSICGHQGSDRARLAWTVSDGPGFVRSYTTPRQLSGRAVATVSVSAAHPGASERNGRCLRGFLWLSLRQVLRNESNQTTQGTTVQYAAPRRFPSHGYQSVMDGAHVRFHVEDAPSHLRRTEWIADLTVPPWRRTKLVRRTICAIDPGCVPCVLRTAAGPGLEREPCSKRARQVGCGRIKTLTWYLLVSLHAAHTRPSTRGTPIQFKIQHGVRTRQANLLRLPGEAHARGFPQQKTSVRAATTNDSRMRRR